MPLWQDLSRCAAVWLSIAAWPASAGAQTTSDLTKLSLEELMKLPVTSVTSGDETVMSTAAAAFVITRDDIRRSGATTIAEVLRMAPGLSVARIDSHTWAISPRGFNDRGADKMLVLIDGRSVFNPFNAGIDWDSLDLMLDNVARIEVIRGPGATLWAANAVNGVINIISRQPEQTPGLRIRAGSSSTEPMFVNARFGGALSPRAAYRVWGRYFAREPFADASTRRPADWISAHVGGRVHVDFTSHDSVTVTADSIRSSIGEVERGPIFTPPFEQVATVTNRLHRSAATVRWDHVFANTSTLVVDSSIDHSDRTSVLALGRTFTIAEGKLEHRLRAGRRQHIVWGGGYRLWSDTVDSSNALVLDPPHSFADRFNAFLQDSVSMARNRLVVTAGTKIEEAEFMGVAVEPSVRAIWLPNARHSVWGSVSHAVRAPARFEFDSRINAAIGPTDAGLAEVSLFGNRAQTSESVVAYEAGYRAQPSSRLFFDAAAFVNEYRGLMAYVPAASFFEQTPVPHLVLAQRSMNAIDGRTAGVEVWGHTLLVPRIEIGGSYALLAHDLTGPAATAREAAGLSPRHQGRVQATLQLPNNVEAVATWTRVGRLPALAVEAYSTLDARVEWRVRSGASFEAGVRNLIGANHVEFGDRNGEYVVPIPRSVFAGLRFER